MPVEESPAGSWPARALRRAELQYLHDGDRAALDRADALLGRCRGDVAEATRWWLSLLRADRDGDDAVDRCIAAVDPVADRHVAHRRVLAAALARRCARDGDLADLDRAIDLLEASEDEVATRAPVWLGAGWRALERGTALLERFRLLDTENDLAAATALIAGAGPRGARSVVGALRLGRLAACDHENYLQTGRRSALERALSRYRRALAGLGDGAPARPLLLTELGTVHQDRYAQDECREDRDEALRLARLAVATESSTGADLACHLVNLGNAWEQVHLDDVDDTEPLREALTCWRRALRHLPAGSPYRAAFLDRLALGLVRGVETGLAEPGAAEEAVEVARVAVRYGARSPLAAVYANHLAEALSTRWEIHGAPGDLHEAVTVLEAAVTSSSAVSVVGPSVITNLAQLHIYRYETLGDPADLDCALVALDRLADVPVGRGERAALDASRASLELAWYAFDGGRPRLDAAITYARRAEVATAPGSELYASRSGYLASGLYRRYALTGHRRDLDSAISGLSGRGEGSATNPDRLATFLQERHERYGDTADARAAAYWAEVAAGAPDHRTDGSAATHGLALVLHGRFEVAGRLADLDEAVERHREALARMHAGAPARPIVLSNLGIALQDRYVYRGDDTDLDEAISTHEEAVASVPRGSPDRPGLVHTLAAAVHVRADRDRDSDDVELAVALDEQALEALPPQSPERPEFLANLAASRSLQGDLTGRRDHADRAVETFRAALARLPPGRSMRAPVLHGYASALAERYDRFGLPADRRRAAAAHRRAVTAAADNPVVALEAASRWALWSARQQLWADAVDAWRAASAARWHLFGVQADPEHGSDWLRRDEETAAVGALALVRCNRPLDALVALDAGRGLRLTRALEQRSTVERLLRAGHPDLGERLEQALSDLAAVVTTSDRRRRLRLTESAMPRRVREGHGGPSGDVVAGAARRP
jgi:tetratricopeptide (TPR) repeat protein